MSERFSRLARKMSDSAGTPAAFLVAVGSIAVWAGIGPLLDYSSGWQFVLTTGTATVTFLMVFLIQNAQNRDQMALQLKLDELLKAVTGARTGLVRLEELSEDQIAALRSEFRDLAEKHGDDVALEPAETAGKSA